MSLHRLCDSNKIMQIFRGGVGATNLSLLKFSISPHPKPLPHKEGGA